MFKPPLSQIDGYFNGFLGALNFSANGSSTNATSAITTVLSTAGKGGVSVPLQVASTALGVITASPNNRVEIVSNATKERIQDAEGNEVYGLLTEASGVYTIAFYSLDSGTQTAYSFASSTAIDFYFQYRFDLGRLPEDFATALSAKVISQDPRSVSGGASPLWMQEKLTVTALNTIADLTKTPTASNQVQLIVNGLVYDSLSGGTSAFTVSGKDITWSAANAGFDVLTSFNVIAFYPTLE